MSRHINIEIKGDIDTLSLWELIKGYKVNLMALDGVTYIYGDIRLHNLGAIIERCALFGALNVSVKGGGDNEQKKAT